MNGSTQEFIHRSFARRVNSKCFVYRYVEWRFNTYHTRLCYLQCSTQTVRILACCMRGSALCFIHGHVAWRVRHSVSYIARFTAGFNTEDSQFHENKRSGSWIVTWERTDRQKDKESYLHSHFQCSQNWVVNGSVLRGHFITTES
jgi:hypothetical protein